MNSDVTVIAYSLNGVPMDKGTYGATASGAEFIDNTSFSGTGILTVVGPAIDALLMIVR
jgi:hypothetical protein